MTYKTMNIQIEPSWKVVLADEFEKHYFKDLTGFVKEEYLTSTVYPHPKDIFTAFFLTPYDSVKVVILGQDPYHGGQAHGLSFSVQDGVRMPPSLRNIFKEVEADTGTTPDSANGDLSRWARQGVLLLNATLTVQAHSPGSHQKKGWEEFTTAVIKKLSDDKEHLIFILWGNYAKSKGVHIDRKRHLVIESAHPSPLSAYNGFFGSKPFTKSNKYLRKKGLEEIDWR